jgi:hypothetical protein
MTRIRHKVHEDGSHKGTEGTMVGIGMVATPC